MLMGNDNSMDGSYMYFEFIIGTQYTFFQVFGPLSYALEIGLSILELLF